MPAAELQALDAGPSSADVDLVITSYGSLLRVAVAGRRSRGAWSSSTRRRRSRIPAPSRRGRSSSSTAQARIALTGTPVENRLGDLWSIFDFINPGLLGSAKEFARFAKRLADAAAQSLRRRCASWCGPTSCGG